MRDEELRNLERKALEGDARALADLRAAWKRLDVDEVRNQAAKEFEDLAVFLPTLTPSETPAFFQLLTMTVEAVEVQSLSPTNPPAHWKVVRKSTRFENVRNRYVPVPGSITGDTTFKFYLGASVKTTRRFVETYQSDPHLHVYQGVKFTVIGYSEGFVSVRSHLGPAWFHEDSLCLWTDEETDEQRAERMRAERIDREQAVVPDDHDGLPLFGTDLDFGPDS